ncbi:hypothetical protein C3L33_07540, partial [Rhododendron williamsianum]
MHRHLPPNQSHAHHVRAVSLSTTNPSYLSFPHPFSILPPLSTSSFFLHLSPSSHPPLSSPPDTVLVRSSMLPTGKADPDDLRRLFSKPTAAETGHPYFVSALIDAGADVNNRDSEGKSVASLAVRKGDVDSVRIILTESGFKIDNSMDTLLHNAAAVDRVDIMEVLCLGFQDIDVNSVDSNGRTALHVAAVCGKVNSIQFLLSVGGDPDIVDSNGWAPLHFAVAGGHVEAAEWLLDATTFAKSAVTKEGLTAYALAAEKGHSELYDSRECEREGPERVDAAAQGGVQGRDRGREGVAKSRSEGGRRGRLRLHAAAEGGGGRAC